MTNETALIITAGIAAFATIATGVLTFFTNRKTNKISREVGTVKNEFVGVHDKLTEVHKEVNGMKDELVESTRLHGEAVGNAQGRIDMAKEMTGRLPSLIALDDDTEDLELMRLFIAKMNIPNPYVSYSDEDEFLEHLTSESNMYVIDHKLLKRNGLNIVHAIRAKSENSIIMLSTGSEQDITGIYINSGVEYYVFKNSENYKSEFQKYIRAGLMKVAKRR